MDPFSAARPSPFDGLDPFERPSSLASRHVDEMVEAWRRGERPPAESFLADLEGSGDDAAIRLIFEEFCLRREAGLEADPVEFARRFPRWWPDVELILDCERLMAPEPESGAFPGVGEDLAGFRLLAELGEGSQGKVFLASQFALADRPVVVKVTPVGRREHLSLARLQHMNIVPLYSARVLPDRGLQVLCMPFLGGATLAGVLKLLAGVEPGRRDGAQLVEALDRAQASLPEALPAPRGPFRRHLARCSYVEAIGWIGIGLADGLQYAHDRNFVHMDIKPSNVLIAGDGQPMLLDFHLAREPLEPGDPPPSHLGGTPGCMAPEQALALESVAENRPIAAPLDGRADLYSLGVLLYEALGGDGDEGRRRPLHRCNPRVSIGLSDVVHKCLQPDPAGRYPDASSLASDLRRFLEGVPLRGVANRSFRERWRNWRRRRPHALARALILAVAAVTATSAMGLLRAAYLQRAREVDAALDQARASLDRRQPLEATRSLRRAQALAEDCLGPIASVESSANRSNRARKQARADELHRLAELLRFRYGIDPPPPEEAADLIARGKALWDDRALLTSPVADAEANPIIRADLLDLGLAWATLRVKSAPADRADQARREALLMLDQAEALLGPVAAIDRDRQVYVNPGEARLTPPLKPKTASGHFELGKSYLRTGEIALAEEQFRLGLDLRPQDFWPNFYQGACAYRLGRFEEAVNAFRVAIALAPDSAEGYFNRALALAALGLDDRAVADYTRALGRNPNLAEAALNRGMLRYRRGQLEEAAADLDQALTSAPGPKARGTIHYNLALVDLARGDRQAARGHLDRAVENGHDAARSLRDRLPR